MINIVLILGWKETLSIGEMSHILAVYKHI